MQATSSTALTAQIMRNLCWFGLLYPPRLALCMITHTYTHTVAGQLCDSWLDGPPTVGLGKEVSSLIAGSQHTDSATGLQLVQIIIEMTDFFIYGDDCGCMAAFGVVWGSYEL